MKKALIPLGPLHPLLEEPEFFKLYVEGERVVDIDIDIGYMHRGIEKLAESKTWDQDVFLVERICGICSTSHPFAYVKAVEDLSGIKAPPRARYIRSIIAELERIHSHLLWAGLAGHFIGYDTVFMWAWKYREIVLDICEKLTGNRNHYAMFRPGGVRRDFDDEQIDYALKHLEEVVQPAKLLLNAVQDDPVLHARLKGVGVLKTEDAIAYCAVGPTARGSNVPIDVRVDDPLGAYDEMDWNVIVETDGDVYAKAIVRLKENFESYKIIKFCLENMPDGPIDAGISEVPPGEGCGHYEAPRGEVFHYVRSNGANMPYRHKVRAPTFSNLPTFQASCIGETIADVALITASIDPCYCCTERMTVVDDKGRENVLKENDLIKLSIEKTRKLQKKMNYKSSLSSVD